MFALAGASDSASETGPGSPLSETAVAAVYWPVADARKCLIFAWLNYTDVRAMPTPTPGVCALRPLKAALIVRLGDNTPILHIFSKRTHS
jgi:hypothetical protein